MILSEVNDRQDAYERRLQTMDSRAGVLVASSGIAATLISSWDGNGWLTLTIASALCSAILGVLALLPQKSTSRSTSNLREQVYGLSVGRALLDLIDHKIATQSVNEKRIVRKARLLQAGFAIFAGTIFFALLSTTGIQITIN